MHTFEVPHIPPAESLGIGAHIVEKGTRVPVMLVVDFTTYTVVGAWKLDCGKVKEKTFQKSNVIALGDMV